MKILNYKFLILITVVLISFFFLFLNFFEKKEVKETDRLKKIEDNFINSNIIKDINLNLLRALQLLN